MKSGLALLLVFTSVSLANASIEAKRLRILYNSEGAVEAALLLPPTPVAADVLSELGFGEEQPGSDVVPPFTVGTLNPAVSEYLSRRKVDTSFNWFDGFELAPITRNRDYLSWLAADPQTSLYTVDLTTGAVTLVGLIGSPGDNLILQGLTVIPEPSAVPLVAAFLALVRFRRLRRTAS